MKTALAFNGLNIQLDNWQWQIYFNVEESAAIGYAGDNTSFWGKERLKKIMDNQKLKIKNKKIEY